jgi:tryptophanyl-tRNA synthetase
MASNFYLKTSKNVGNVWTLLNNYSVASNVLSSIVIGISLSNTTGTAISANVGVFTGNYAAGSAANIYLVYNAPISSGGTLVPVGVDQKLVLQPNYSIFVQSSTTSSVDAVMSVLELT